MATKKPAVEIPVRLNKDQAQKDAKGLTADMIKNFAKIGAGIAAAKVAFDAFAVVMGKAIDLTKESIALADVQIKAERGLIAAIRQRQKFTDAEFDSLQRFNAEVQQATTIGDEQLLQVQRQLVLQGAEKDQLQDLTKAVIGLSQVKGQGFAEAATVVTRVLRGEVGALKETGIVVNSVDEGIQRLKDNFVFATHETLTFSGQVKLLQANFGDFQEEIGRNYAESQRLITAFESLNKVVLEFTDFFKSSEGAQAIDRFFKLLIGFAAETIDAFTGISDAADILRFKTPASVKRQEVYESAREEFLKAAPRAHVFDPVTGQATVGGIDYDLINEMAREFALERVPLTITEIAKNFADELRAVAVAPYKKAAFPQTAPTAPSGGQALAGGITLADPFGFEADEAALERKKELDRLQLDQTIAANELRFQAELQAFDEREKLKQREIAATENFYANLSSIGIGGMANFISGIVQAGLSGEADLSQMMVRLFGGMLSQVGQMLISLGTAAFLAATASTALPFLWPITGGPIGAGGALGIVAAGAALTGVGGYVSSTARTTTASLRRVEGTARRMAPSTVDRAGRPSRAQQETTQTVYNINFNGALPGSERRIAREIKRIMSGGFAAAGA